MRRLLLSLLVLTALGAAAPASAATRKIRSLPSTWQKGMNVTAFRWDDLDRPEFRSWIVRLRRNAHADYAMFVTRWFQYAEDPLDTNGLAVTQIHPAFGSNLACRKADRSDQTRCQTPSLESEDRAIVRARSLGLHIALKPLLDVGRTADEAQSRESIDMTDPDERRAWFDAYKGMLARYVRLARDRDVDMLVIGTGLTGMTNEPDDLLEWRDIVTQIRDGSIVGDGKGGYAGWLTYAARWDSIYGDAGDKANHLFFWDALDFVGVEGFWPLVTPDKNGSHNDPSVARLRQGWTYNFLLGGLPPAVALRALHEEYDKPVLLTGLGYLSRGGTAADPAKGDGEQKAVGGRINNRSQVRPYRAAFDFWSALARDEDWFRGIYWWNWNATITAFHNGDYSPQGKPAETELCLRHLGRFSRSCRPSGRPRTA
jgi:hypothetical protein